MTLGRIHLVLMLALALYIPALWAQDQTQQSSGSRSDNNGASVSPLPPTENGANGNQKPASSARGLLLREGDIEPQEPASTQPDTHALSGAENTGTGSLGQVHNVVNPSLFLSEFGDTGIPIGSSRLNAITQFGGNIDLDHTWRRYRIVGVADAGDSLAFAPPSPLYQSWYGDLAVEQQINWSRWILRFRDTFQFTPQASFGSQSTGGPGTLGQFDTPSSLGVVNPDFTPAESVLTGSTMRLGLTSIAEADYAISRRSQITFDGSYGLLHFVHAGYINSQQTAAQVGYDYLVDPKDTIAVMASYGHTMFSGSSFAIEYDQVQAAFARKVTGRLAFQVGGGPAKVRLINVPAPSPRLGWGLNSALTYELRRTGYSLMYTRNVTSGSGVLLGAQTQNVVASVHHRLSRSWVSSLSAGYTRSSSLVPVAVAASRFSSWYAGANAGHQIGQYISIGFNYGVQRQYSNSSACPVANCGVTNLWQTFGATLTWHPRPFLIG
jgi:hypothetical protein